MNFKNNIAVLEAASDGPKKPKSPAKRFTRSLEYELIASLILQQYQKNGEPNFKGLLSIPVEDRIPGLMAEFGNKRTHRLLVMILKEFCAALPLPKSKKLTDTRISVCAAEIMISAEEDQLALEDVILFLETAKQGKYGAIKNLQRHWQLMELLERYRQARHEAYMQEKGAADGKQKASGPKEKTAPQPTAIGDLFSQAPVIDITQRMSG